MTPGPGAALARRHAIAERYSQGDFVVTATPAGMLASGKACGYYIRHFMALRRVYSGEAL